MSVMLYLAEFKNELKMRFPPSVCNVNQFLLFIKVTTCFYDFNYVIYMINCLGLNILCPQIFLFVSISDLFSWSLYLYWIIIIFLKKLNNLILNWLIKESYNFRNKQICLYSNIFMTKDIICGLLDIPCHWESFWCQLFWLNILTQRTFLT